MRSEQHRCHIDVVGRGRGRGRPGDRLGRPWGLAADALLGLSLATLDPADLEPGHRDAADLTPDERHAIEQLVAERTKAREQHDWSRADQVRAELEARGVTLTDTPAGPVWKRRP
jgi:cysteinyl-tRNA synthetase